ncbi:MAG: PIG-L family deacetylase [Planctomycetes bacterium]|nr:PIG-L family deacetylase [Planctomycetota bacterium]
MRVLAVGAHPDDIEILCAGTLARCKARGDAVHMCIVTDGAAGHRQIGPDELREVRMAEAAAAAETLGAEMHWLDIPDEGARNDQGSRLLLVDAIRRARPDLIITHGPDDYHPDHLAAWELVRDASFMAGLCNVRTRHPAIENVPPLFIMDTLMGVGFTPEIYVDVTDAFPTKQRMLEKHVSQLKFLKEHTTVDIMNVIEVVARFRGLQCGVKMAEAFRQWRAWPRVGVARLLP